MTRIGAIKCRAKFWTRQNYSGVTVGINKTR